YDLLDATAASLGFSFAELLTRAATGVGGAEEVPDADAWYQAAEDLTDTDERLRQQTDLELAQKRLLDDELEQINPVHVRRFLEVVADWQGWDVKNGPADGLHIVDASPRRLPAFLGGTTQRMVATDGQAVADAVRY